MERKTASAKTLYLILWGCGAIILLGMTAINNRQAMADRMQMKYTAAKFHQLSVFDGDEPFPANEEMNISSKSSFINFLLKSSGNYELFPQPVTNQEKNYRRGVFPKKVRSNFSSPDFMVGPVPE